MEHRFSYRGGVLLVIDNILLTQSKGWIWFRLDKVFLESMLQQLYSEAIRICQVAEISYFHELVGRRDLGPCT